jgi:hypothetical protein
LIIALLLDCHRPRSGQGQYLNLTSGSALIQAPVRVKASV